MPRFSETVEIGGHIDPVVIRAPKSQPEAQPEAQPDPQLELVPEEDRTEKKAKRSK